MSEEGTQPEVILNEMITPELGIAVVSKACEAISGLLQALRSGQIMTDRPRLAHQQSHTPGIKAWPNYT